MREDLFDYDFGFSHDCKFASFRLDFFSKSAFISKLQDASDRIIGEFSIRNLSDEEKQMVDIKSVAANLEISTYDIEEKKVFIFDWRDEDLKRGEMSYVIVSPYFVFVFCRGRKKLIDSLSNKFKEISSIIELLSGELNVIGLRFSARFIILSTKTAFPIFGLKFFDEKIPDDTQKYEIYFSELSQEETPIVKDEIDDEEFEEVDEYSQVDYLFQLRSMLSYVKFPEEKEYFGEVNVNTHAFSLIACPESECLKNEYVKLIEKTQKFMNICAR